MLNRNELSRGDEGVEGRTSQKEGALCAKAQKGEGLCHARFRQPSDRFELLWRDGVRNDLKQGG